MAGTLIVQNLQGPASGANANKIIIPSGQTLDASAGGMTLPAGVGGKVLQVLNNSGNTTLVSSSTTFIDTPQTISITPMSTSSKIIVQMVNAVWSAAGNYTYARIVMSGGASGTLVSWGDFYQGYYGNAPIFGVHENHNTTSQITYTLQGRADGNSWYMPNNNANSDASTKYMSVIWEIAG